MYKRLVNLSQSNSFFLFGARGTGKSTLLAERLSKQNTRFIDLLDPEQERVFATRPSTLLQYLESSPLPAWIVIDEVQKVPSLLDIVHIGIEQKKQKFAITGSSARKLRRGAANLLAGRAFEFRLHPLTSFELGEDFELNTYLSFGGLPKLYDFASDQDKKRFLHAYANTYLKEEIQIEQLVRKVEPFRLFLEVAAQSSGKIVSFSKLAAEGNIGAKSVERYFEILIDTFLGFYLPPYTKSIRKRQSQHPKFYFFDTGVLRAIENTLDVPIRERTYEFGRLFEHFIILECFRLNDYYEKRFRFFYLRTKDNVEIDLIIERPGKKSLFIEIKSSEIVSENDVRGLLALSEDARNVESIVLSRTKFSQRIGKIQVMPWQMGLQYIFQLT